MNGKQELERIVISHNGNLKLSRIVAAFCRFLVTRYFSFCRPNDSMGIVELLLWSTLQASHIRVVVWNVLHAH